MMSIIPFVLSHLVQQRNKAQDSKSEHPDNTEHNSPGLAIIHALNEQHKTNNGNQDSGSKKWELHRKPFYQI